MQDTGESIAPVPEPASSSAESSPAPEPRAGLSDDARIQEDLSAGIRARLGGRSGDDEAAPRRPDGDEDDDEDDDEDGAEAPEAPEASPAPATEAAPGPEPPPTAPDEAGETKPLTGRARLRADLATARQRTAELEGQVADLTRQLGGLDARYRELKPQEAAAVLSDDEFRHLEYVERRGQLSYDDQLRLETARTLREYRQVWIDDRDRQISERLGAVKSAFAEAAKACSELPGVKAEALRTAPSFEDMFRHFHEAGARSGRAELQEENARLKQDNTALSAVAAGRSAKAPALGGRSAPTAAEVPGSDAPSQDQIAAGIRQRYGSRRNGHR